MPSELTPATLAELKWLKAEATPGPYEFCKGPYLANVRTRSTNRLCCEDYAAYQRPEDAAYDAALRNHADALITAAEERNHIEVLRLEACAAWADCIAERDELKRQLLETRATLATEAARLNHILDAFDGDEEINGATAMDYWDADAMDAEETKELRRAWRESIDAAMRALKELEEVC